MIVYHGSNLEVQKPKLLVPNRFLDFGPGFYTTTNFEQATSFAQKVCLRANDGQAIVNEYELDDDYKEKLSILEFKNANEEWLDFVSNNRNGNMEKHSYDLIVGPVADDNIYRTFLLYQTGVLSKEQTIEMLRVKELFNQFVFATDKSIDMLKFSKSLNVGGGSKDE